MTDPYSELRGCTLPKKARRLAAVLSLAAALILGLTACGTAESQGSLPESSTQADNLWDFTCPTSTLVSNLIGKDLVENPFNSVSFSCAFLNADHMASGDLVISETVVFEEAHGVSLSDLRKASEIGGCTATSVDDIGNEAFFLECPGAATRFAFTSANGNVRYVDVSYLDAQTGLAAQEGDVSENLVRRLINETGFAQ